MAEQVLRNNLIFEEESRVMTKFQEIELLIADLPKEEQAQLAKQLLVMLSHSSPSISHQTGVNGGRATIARTRIPVWTIIEAKKEGINDANLLQAFPSLSAEDVVNAWAYYLSHREEIDQDIEDQNED